jgi:PAS domain S-box-containing protein
MHPVPDTLSAKLLVVDDQKASVLLLERMLGGAGYTSVESTMDPREVCGLHRQNRYDLILLDLLMPGMYGFQVIEGLREIETEADLPILVISGQPEYKKRALQAGAKEFVSKPVEGVELLAQVHKMLHARLSRRRTQHDRGAAEQSVHEHTAKLRESEELFRQIEEFSPDGLWIRELKGDLIHYVNPAWEKITGQPLAAGDLLDRAFAAMHPDDLPRVMRETEKRPNGGVDLECRIVRPDGALRWVHFRTFPIRAAKQKIVRIAGIMEDITERKTASVGNA